MIDKEEKIRRIAGLKAYQEKVFKAINVEIETVLYIPRMAYKPTGHHEIVITLFSSEFKTEQDIYTEFVNREYESEDPHRILYKWKYNPFWLTEYATSEDTIPNSVKYYIPVSELLVISKDGEVRDDKNEDPKPIGNFISSNDLSKMLKKPEVIINTPSSIFNIPIKDLTLKDLRELLNKMI